LPAKAVPEMIYTVSGGTLLTHLLTHLRQMLWQCLWIEPQFSDCLPYCLHYEP